MKVNKVIIYIQKVRKTKTKINPENSRKKETIKNMDLIK